VGPKPLNARKIAEGIFLDAGINATFFRDFQKLEDQKPNGRFQFGGGILKTKFFPFEKTFSDAFFNLEIAAIEKSNGEGLELVFGEAAFELGIYEDWLRLKSGNFSHPFGRYGREKKLERLSLSQFYKAGYYKGFPVFWQHPGAGLKAELLEKKFILEFNIHNNLNINTRNRNPFSWDKMPSISSLQELNDFKSSSLGYSSLVGIQSETFFINITFFSGNYQIIYNENETDEKKDRYDLSGASFLGLLKWANKAELFFEASFSELGIPPLNGFEKQQQKGVLMGVEFHQKNWDYGYEFNFSELAEPFKFNETQQIIYFNQVGFKPMVIRGNISVREESKLVKKKEMAVLMEAILKL